MRTTPPHATNCHHVCIEDGGVYLVMNDGKHAFDAACAALEEVAWRKEADRLGLLLEEMCGRNMERYIPGFPTPDKEITKELRNAIEAAEDSVLAWRAWEANYE
jgi:hypothetical protein